MDSAICVDRISKRYRRYPAHGPRTFQEAVIAGFHGLFTSESLWALHDISFAVPRGSVVGVIGANGSGKSTLLRLLGGVGKPDSGTIRVTGRVGALLDLGASFHPDLTGRENVYVSAVTSGLTRAETRREFDSIVEFAELADFIDSPIRTYSTGMLMRLAFAVAAHVDPDILLIDEALSVGDVVFQTKCLDRVRQFRQHGCSIVLVSHDTSVIGELCDEALWLREGRVLGHGPADAVVSQYLAHAEEELQRRAITARDTRQRTPPEWAAQRTPAGHELRVHENRFGSLEAQIVSVRLISHDCEVHDDLQNGDPLRIEINVAVPETSPAPILQVHLFREDGLVCLETSTEGIDLLEPGMNGTIRATLDIERLDLSGGRYFVDVGAYAPDWAYAYDYHSSVYSLAIRPDTKVVGVLCPPFQWSVRAKKQTSLVKSSVS